MTVKIRQVRKVQSTECLSPGRDLETVLGTAQARRFYSLEVIRVRLNL